MIRRSLGAALWTLVGLLAGFLGALSSLVGTGAGRALLARVSEGALHQVFTGTMEIGDVHGSLLTGLTLSQVRLFDADTTLVAWLPEVNVSYNPFDFAAGRVVLFEFDLRQPVINIVQHPATAGEAPRAGRLEPRDRERRPQRAAARPSLRAPRCPALCPAGVLPAGAGRPHRHLPAGHGERGPGGPTRGRGGTAAGDR
ncbi:MAG: hypothetical protein AUI13_18945 [Gemmatimonadetes bacterium 13_2_20CM_2_69_23]|nr:MAG: hypothetical protein AUI13_18945 [Gemmatimonadetes bacterium 13_2_20CM_2_69_23]